MPERPTSSDGGAALTVALAGVANLAIAVAKLVGGLVAGSSAMLSEAAHSLGDTLNQALLLTAQRRSRRPPDARHPFGYGKERYFWALLAAVAVFVLGAGFSCYQGIVALVHPPDPGDPLIAFVVLAVAFLFDGISLVRACWQLREEAGQLDIGVLHYLLHDAEPTVRAVTFEDTAALVGVLLAGGGLALDELLESHVYDAVASLLIGALLVVVAGVLGRQNQDLLIGQAADPELQRGLSDAVSGTRGIRDVLELMTMRLGPDEMLLAARVDVDPDQSGDALEEVADEVERRVRSAYPQVRHVFVDPTPGGPAQREAGSSRGDRRRAST